MTMTSQFIHSQQFQQRADHKITAHLDDKRHVITGIDTITYYNNSPSTLHKIYFQLWANAFNSPNSTLSLQMLEQGDASLYFENERNRGNLSGISFSRDGTIIPWNYDEGYNDLCYIFLKEPLRPGEKAILRVMFRLQIPDNSGTMPGHYNNAYFFTNWFPKPVMYDSTGWYRYPNRGIGDAFSPYGNYDVEITLPENYIVGASGILINNADEEKQLEKLNDKTRKVSRWGTRKTPSPASSRNTKTLHYLAENVTGFSWTADKRYNLLIDSVALADSTYHVDIHVLFTNQEAAYWIDAAEDIKQALRYYNDRLGKYPYPSLTVAQTPWNKMNTTGPAFIQIGSVMNSFDLKTNIFEQIAKIWFHEKTNPDRYRSPWLSESISAMYGLSLLMDVLPDTATLQDIYTDPGLQRNLFEMKHFPVWYKEYLAMLYHKEQINQPGDLRFEEYTKPSYDQVIFRKNALALLHLRDYLGPNDFDRIIKKYLSIFEGKHPNDIDFKNLLQNETDKPVAWFFDDLIKKEDWPDYKIASIKKLPDNQYRLTIKNRSTIAIPFSISWTSPDSSGKVWHDPVKEKETITITVPEGVAVKRFIIDKNYYIPEINRKNNTIRTKGILKKLKPPVLQIGGAIPHPEKAQINYFPVAGWNKYDGLMAGVALYSNPLFTPKTEYLFMPLWGFNSNDIAGCFSITHHIQPDKGFFDKIVIGGDVKQYHYENKPVLMPYQRIAPYLKFSLRQDNPKSSKHHTIELRHYYISQQTAQSQNDTSTENNYVLKNSSYYINRLQYKFTEKRILNPYSIEFDIQQGSDLLKASLTGKYFLTYKAVNKGLSIRFFGGYFFKAPKNSPYDARFRFSGIEGQGDYLYEHIFPARNISDGFWWNHFYEGDGFFKSYSTTFNTWNWLTAVNFSTTIPLPLPIEVYFDIGTSGSEFILEKDKQFFIYDGGMKLSLIKEAFEVYFPIVRSPLISESDDLNNRYSNYFEQIRFVLNLKLFNPIKLSRQVEFL